MLVQCGHHTLTSQGVCGENFGGLCERKRGDINRREVRRDGERSRKGARETGGRTEGRVDGRSCDGMCEE